jgi:tetratricopeptide (TPR) repeat protein
MSTRNQNVWLFGSFPDLLLGAGLLYLFIVSGLLIWGSGARDAIPASWIAYLLLIVSGSHYGGTLLRVYEHRAERRIYRLFTVHGTIVMGLVLVGALYSPIAGSFLITLYLTWSPWHYTGQNYGIAVMFLRRRGVEITPIAKRLLHASFVLSFLLVLLTMHFEGSAGQADPLGYRSLDPDKFQFISAGLPAALRTYLMPAVGLAYLASAAAAATLLFRAGGARAVAPTALLMFTQAVWFSIPYLVAHFGLAAGIPALNAIDVEGYAFYFVWVALGHAAQYLWITAYYARTDQRWRGYASYFTKVFIFGNAVWAAPVIAFGPETLGRPDYDFGLAMCVAAAVNLHHFILDGAIWKLRNPRLAAVLLRGQTGMAQENSTQGAARWTRRIAWSFAVLFCLARVVPYIELDQRFPSALSRSDYSTAQAILDRAAFYGRDSAALRLQLANRLVKTPNPARSLPHYWRSLKLHPNAPAFAKFGVLSERLQGVEHAIFVWEEGLERFPDDFDLNRQLGIGLMKLRRPVEAVPYLERAVSMRPEDVGANAALAEARSRLDPLP